MRIHPRSIVSASPRLLRSDDSCAFTRQTAPQASLAVACHWRITFWQALRCHGLVGCMPKAKMTSIKDEGWKSG